MKILKRYSKTIGIFTIIIILISFGFALLNLGGLMNFSTTNILFMILMVMIFLIIGYKYGKKADKKGYIEGLKIGICLILVLLFINLIFYNSNISLERVIYYFILILSSIMGSMIGINKKER